MRGAIPPLPNMPSWRGSQKKSTGITLPFTFTLLSSEFVFRPVYDNI
jgi:hypothetical protein